MRLLPVGPEHVGVGAACGQPASDRFRYQRRDVGKRRPLRDLCPYSRSDQARRHRTGRLTMSPDQVTSQASDQVQQPPASSLSRRAFLYPSAAAGGGLMLSLSLPFANGAAEAADNFAPNAFIRIDGDGQIVLTMPYVEMGQGTYTSIPMLIAEELEVELKQVRLEHAPPNEKLYAKPLFRVQSTRHSHAMRGSWQP